MIECIECNVEKTKEEFYENRTRPTKTTARCRECTDEIKAGLDRTVKGVYILHFDRPVTYSDAWKYGDNTGGHYIGWSRDIRTRVWDHRQGEGSAMTKAAVAQGIGWQIAGMFPGGEEELESALIRQGASSNCSVCRLKEDEMYKAHLAAKKAGIKWDKKAWLEANA